MTKLTAKQEELFNRIGSGLRKEVVLEFIKNGYENGTKAYINACKNLNRGASKNPEVSASEILSYPNVIHFIDSTKIEAANEAQVDANWVIKGIKDLTIKLKDSDSPQHAYKGYELMGRHLKLFTDNIDLNATVAITRIERKIV